MAFRPRFLGVNRRRFGLIPPDLSALDGLPRSQPVGQLTQRKTRGPRRLNFLPKPLPVRRQRGRRGVLVPY